MEKFAVVRTGGKQYIVREGEKLSTEKLPVAVGGKIVFDEVLLIADGAKVKVGTPLTGVTIEAEVEEQGKGKKVHVIKFKSKTRYRRNKGHRQLYTKVAIKKIA
jgi:large subunit ribosomal protein L21